MIGSAPLVATPAVRIGTDLCDRAGRLQVRALFHEEGLVQLTAHID